MADEVATYLGDTLYRSGKIMEALAQFEKAEKLNSSEFKIAEFIAKCHDKLG